MTAEMTALGAGVGATRSAAGHGNRHHYGGPNEDLWRAVLSSLEIMAELEAASSAGFLDDREGDFDDEDYDDERFEGKQELNTEAASGMQKRLSTALDRFGEAQLTELDLRNILARLRDHDLPEMSVALVLVDQMRDHLADKANALDYVPRPTGSGKVVIVGDLHGHLNDLLRLLDQNGDPNEHMRYVFNGDFVDRGIWGPEVLFTLYCLRLLHPTCVFLNRGNHETKFCTDRYGFIDDLDYAYPGASEELYFRIHESFDQLPLCHIVADSVFVVHGGLPAHMVTRRDLERLVRGPFPQKPGRSAKIRTFQALLWSDPRDDAGKSARGMGCHFNKEMTEAFLQDNGNLQCIVRSHECVGNGFDEKHDGLCKTVFSASNYDATNDASVVVIDADLNVKQGMIWNEPYMPKPEDLDLGDDDDAADDARGVWKGREELAKKGIDNLSKRVKDDRLYTVSPKERGLDEVCQMIFLNRSQLLDRFVAADKNPDSPGQVTVQEWLEVMSLVLRTPHDFPWEGLGPYLFRPEKNGKILYMDFLLRYDSPFSAWLGDQWCVAILDQLANKTHAFNQLFDELDTARTGSLSYSSMRTLLGKVTQDHKAMDATQALNESVRIYTLFRKLDRDRSGRVQRDEFLVALKEQQVEELSASQSPTSGGPLTKIAKMSLWASLSQVRVCNKCGLDISASEPSWSHVRDGFDLCGECRSKVRAGNFASYIHLKRGEERLQVLQRQWDIVEQGLRGLFKSRNDMNALFTLVDKKNTGRVKHRDFVKHMGRALKKDEPTMQGLHAAICQWVFLEREKSGESGAMRVKELKAAFAVRDQGEDFSTEVFGTKSFHGRSQSFASQISRQKSQASRKASHAQAGAYGS